MEASHRDSDTSDELINTSDETLGTSPESNVDFVTGNQAQPRNRDHMQASGSFRGPNADEQA